VTQATVSRDLRELGATKLRSGDEFVYRLQEDVRGGSGGDLVSRNLQATLDQFVLDVATAGSLVILQTAPGHAPAVARAVDLAGIDEVVGTVAGDDTIFVATPSDQAALRIADAWIGRTTREEEQV
jgi:transcriptional regulator of arginine metabolism